MNFFRLFQRKTITSASSALKEMIDAAKSRAGAPVTLNTAIEAQAVLACARVIGEGLAQVPLKVRRPLPGGRGSEEARDASLYRVLHRRPNQFQTAFELREMAGMHLVLTGNFFAFINRVRGEVAELLPFEPGQITVTRSGWESSYAWKQPGQTPISIPTADLLHLRGPSMNGWLGLDAVRVARESIGLSLTMEEHTARFFSNGAHGGDMLTTDQSLDPEQVGRLKDQWKENYSGTQNAYKTAILWGGLKWQSRTTDNKLSQLYELRGFQIEDICQRLRVNPIMIGYSGDKTPTYASAEQLFLAHVVHTMGPWYERIEQSMDVYLLNERQQAAGYYVKHVVAGLLRGAHKDRAEFYRTLSDIGALNPNEIRDLEEMNPYPGGDTYRVPLNTAPADAATTTNN